MIGGYNQSCETEEFPDFITNGNGPINNSVLMDSLANGKFNCFIIVIYIFQIQLESKQ